MNILKVAISTALSLSIISAPAFATDIISEPDIELNHETYNAEPKPYNENIEQISNDTFSSHFENLKRQGMKNIYGKDRYETSAKIANLICDDKNNPDNGCETIYMASGQNFPDGITISALAGKNNSAVLLTPNGKLTDPTRNFLTSHNVKNVVIAGGSGSVSNHVEQTIKDLGISTSRLAGKNRYETAIKIARQFDYTKTVFISGGENWPDALVSSALAGDQNVPVLLTKTGSLNDNTRAYLNDYKPVMINVVGGIWSANTTNAMANAANIGNHNVKVFSGKDRYETASKLNYAFSHRTTQNKIGLVSTGKTFADAISAGPLAATLGSNITLSNGNCVIEDARISVPSKGYINIGGPSVVNTNAASTVCPKKYDKWLQEFRSILDSYGAKHIDIVEMTNGCAGSQTWPDACANSSGFIKINKTLASKSRKYKEWVMMHEYAHIVQFDVMDKINKNPNYKRLYNANIEDLANGMAFAKGKMPEPLEYYRYSKEQVDFANKVWNKTI